MPFITLTLPNHDLEAIQARQAAEHGGLRVVPQVREDEEIEAGETGGNPDVPTPVDVDPSKVIYFRPRKNGQVGTRLTFANGFHLAVRELVEEVRAKFNAAST